MTIPFEGYHSIGSFSDSHHNSCTVLGVLNYGFDNINNEYILRVNDSIISPEGEEFIIQELLGKGTFGQVVSCTIKSSGVKVAIKVIKNKPAFTNQAYLEIKILKLLNKLEEEETEHQIVKMLDYFSFRNHLFIIFEQLNCSMYDLLHETKFQGFSLSYIRQITTQMLKGIQLTEKARVIHCDLKPENILFSGPTPNNIKIIDLGSSCFVNHTYYTYIQSRFYRAPEVIFGLGYSGGIDSWSVGCICAELYLGLPIFPGNSEYDQLRRIIDILG